MTDSRQPWDAYLSSRDRKVFEAAGYTSTAAIGVSPVLAVVDVTYEFTGSRPMPVLEAVKEFPTACGEEAWAAVEQIQRLLGWARSREIPVVFTKADTSHPLLQASVWGASNPRLVAPERSMNRIVDEIRPLDNEPVIDKVGPSGFHETMLQNYLTMYRCDTLIVCGGTTSGCVRATAVDAFSRNYSVVVPSDACFDRGEASHAISLFDLAMKYGTVLGTSSLVSGEQRMSIPRNAP